MKVAFVASRRCVHWLCSTSVGIYYYFSFFPGIKTRSILKKSL